ncbi:MAG: Na+/H+ antiporter NhaA [Verrucomicrobiota bacterium]
MKKLKHVLHHEAAPGVLLMFAMLAALVVANSGVAWYGKILDTMAVVGVGELLIKKPLLLWINDGLMAVFFLLVGLELKREVLFGELSNPRKVALPLFAALGGIAVPSGIYAAINWGDEVAMNGWAIPAATDIAFALGILALLGKRVPVALKVFLTSVAVIDDLAAILIIAVFYTDQLSIMSLAFAAGMLVALFALNRARVKAPAPYVLLGIALWVCVLKSGVHATLAGVALAAFIPAGRDVQDKSGLAYRIEHGLHPWVVFLILPVFAFANAGVPILGMSPTALLEPVPLGIAAGLFFGKQIGVFLLSLFAVKVGLARLPEGVNWGQVYGVACLCGIGFTMSLFIGSLAFEGGGGPDYAVDDRIGILTGSFLSAIAGVITLKFFSRARDMEEKPALDGGLLGPQHDDQEAKA